MNAEWSKAKKHQWFAKKHLLETSLEPFNLFLKELNGLNWLKYVKGCPPLEAMPV